jgi:hypothetical protein
MGLPPREIQDKLEVFVNIVMEAEKAGKGAWTDAALLKLLFTFWDTQGRAKRGQVLDTVAKGTHRPWKRSE